ncbi:hypothetical protein N9L92_03920 [Saprospiraceae bacterium]|nr:hypothetical protein [Saprospiraceae bacterium]
MKSITYLSLTFILIIVALSCSTKDQSKNISESSSENQDAVLGTLEHGFPLNPDTHDKFDEGLLLLHNFEYEDALSAFEEATALDSTEVMTHWGEAMCHYKGLWKLQDTDQGKAILSRLGDNREERIASIDTPSEKAMWEMVEIMYGEGDFESRNKSLKSHLASMHKKFPNNQEIAAFYALSLIWATEKYGDGSADLRLAASIVDKVTEVNPLHPGALHYKIHALDGPTSAQDALEAADTYAKVAPDAAHALHMPSHIYLALGEWDGVVNSNQASYDASVNRMIKKELPNGSRGYHSLAWLHYGLLQKGQYTQAEKILNDMLTYVPKDPTKGARGYLLGMQSRQIAESGTVNEQTPLDLDLKVEDIGINSKSKRSFLRAQVAFKNNDIETIDDEIEWLSENIYLDSLNIKNSDIAMCAAGGNKYKPTDNTVKMAQVTLAQIEGLKALLEDDQKLFEVKMKKATELENLTNFPTGPPNIIKPSFEQYGEWLIEKDRYDEALVQFDKALLRMPKRSKSLEGKIIALKALNQLDESAKVREELQGIYTDADAEVKKVFEE